jgi:signal transduction histidine kinase
MGVIHPLLRRQVAKHLALEPSWPQAFRNFIDAVNDAYHQADADRSLLERSLDLSSQELLQANVDVRAIVQAFPDVFLWLGADGTILGCRAHHSSDMVLFTGMVGKQVHHISDESVAGKFREALERIASGAPAATVEYDLPAGEAAAYYEARFIPAHEGQTLAIVRNITDRRLAERSLWDREKQLRQSQRMEAVGLLAGGVAHDFNNVLTAIAGYTSLLLDQMDVAHPLREDVVQIQKAGESAAALTHQLLAFSRRQVLRPTVLSLNTVIARTETMLRPLIGEHITVTATLNEDLHRVRADAGQVEQILTNLIINARDAMPKGGQLTVETSNVELDAEALADEGSPAPGPYVQLTVSDTGCGIPEELQSRVFEPFFTTKEHGHGTGLGLSTVYGIVKQSGGMIRLHSEVGSGTCFTICFPAAGRVDDEVEAASQTAPSGSETILIAEDQAEVRSVTRAVLVSRGYTVLAAASGDEALRVAREYAKPIDLLVTDIVMPNMGGRDLADQVRRTLSGIRVLYVSGYTDDEILRQGVVASSVEFLHKPFTPLRLLQKVRAVLDKPASEG